jgi:hypothetical protein
LISFHTYYSGYSVFDHFQVFDIEAGEVAISVSPEQLLSAPVVIPSVPKGSILYKGIFLKFYEVL